MDDVLDAADGTETDMLTDLNQAAEFQRRRTDAPVAFS